MNNVILFMTNRISVSLTSNETSKASLVIVVTQDKHLVILKLLTFEEPVGENRCGCAAPSRLCCLKRGCTTPKEQKIPRENSFSSSIPEEENYSTLKTTWKRRLTSSLGCKN